jgi:hypothetical protein
MRSSRLLPAALAAILLPTLSSGTIMFERRWHWFQTDVGRSVELTGDGGYVVGAGTGIGGSSYGAALVWVDSLGDTTTVRHVSGLDNGAGYLCRAADDGYMVAGTYDTSHVFVQKFSAAGDSVWTYKSATRGVVQAVISAPDGGCLILGQIPDTLYHMGAIKLDFAGNEQWNRHYTDPGVYATMAQGGAPTKDGGYILCGNGHDYMDTYIRLVKTDSAGQQVWSRLYPGAVDASLHDVTETEDHGFVAVGSEWDTLQSHYALYIVRTDSSGGLLWTRSFSPTGAGTQANAMDITHDSDYVITGTIDWGDSARAWLVRIDSGADTLWTRVLSGMGTEQGTDIRQTADGGYVVAGTSGSAGGSVLLVKTDSLGGVTAGVAEASVPARERAAFSVTPNPATGVVRVEWSLPAGSEPATLRVYDSQGRLIHSSFVTRHSSLSLGIRAMPAGVYVLRLDSDLGTVTRKLVIE